MTASRFLDTNILIYAYDLDAGKKRLIALALVEEGWAFPGTIALSIQVLQEFHVNLVRRGRTIAESADIIRDFAAWPIVENTVPLLEAAMELQEQWGISFWDALIL